MVDAAAVATLPGVTGVVSEPAEAGGVRLTAALADGASGQEALKAAFLKGLDIVRFELKEPTLHDAFIVLTGGQSSDTVAEQPGAAQ